MKRRISVVRGTGGTSPNASHQQLRHESSSSRPSDGDLKLNHLTATGEAHMVDITGKISTKRSATATTVLLFSHVLTYGALLAARLRKGDALAVARVAGIQGAKKAADLIPLAHPGLSITGASVHLEPFVGDVLPHPFTREALGLAQNLYGGVVITATVSCEGKTGVEMEAMTSASVAGLTMYDMLKAVDKAMVLTATRVVAKSGGKSGDWKWDPSRNQIVKDDPLTESKALEHGHEVIQGKKVQDHVRQVQREIDVGVTAPPTFSGPDTAAGKVADSPRAGHSRPSKQAAKRARKRLRKDGLGPKQDHSVASDDINRQKHEDTVSNRDDGAVSPNKTVYKRGRVDSIDFMHGRQQRYARYLDARSS